jgi:HAD superfamily 5'-nucleotidase-like hydrolase
MNAGTDPYARSPRGMFVNRTLNLRSIRAIGYDMDYTLVHYKADEWERLAFIHARRRLAERGWPVKELKFDADSVTRGLAIDRESGNLVKATRFGYVIRAAHGTRLFSYDELRSAYAGVFVDLGEDRFEFMNTLFSLSEAALLAGLVDLLDAGELPGRMTYADLHDAVVEVIDQSHNEGDLKREILTDPDRYIVRDPDTALALLDQRAAGKRLLLITNSEWGYARAIMTYSFDPYLPEGETWRDLFDTVIVSSAKPRFFSSRNPLFKIIDEEAALLQPHDGPLEDGAVYYGGNAGIVEERLDLAGDEILYVGDHLFGDVHVSKAMLRWRTALILRELEPEVRVLDDFLPEQEKLNELMDQKQMLEARLASLRLVALRKRKGYAPPPPEATPGDEGTVRKELAALDELISPLAVASSRLRNPEWGPLMRAGVDKSLFARQVERYADIYTSRVSNFLEPGPYAMLRAGRLDLPHDPHLRHERHAGPDDASGAADPT